MKFTKKQIDAARKTRPVRRTIADLEDFDILRGDLVGLEKRIKETVKQLSHFKNGRWEDGTSYKVSELKIDAGYAGYDGGIEICVYVEKMIPEPDERVIRKLKERAKVKARQKKKKEVQKEKELAELERLKRKYEA